MKKKSKYAQKELREIYQEIGKLRRTIFNPKFDIHREHEFIDTCLIYKMLQKRGVFTN